MDRFLRTLRFTAGVVGAMVLAACGQQADQSVADSVDGPEFTPPALATVIEPTDARVLEGVTLTFDTVMCRNDGGVEAAGIWWQLNEGVPTEWRKHDGTITGDLTMSGELATFTALDGNEVELTSGFWEAGCPMWMTDP